MKEKPKVKVDSLPANVEEWAHYDCPNEIRDALKQKTNSYGINWLNFPKPVSVIFTILEHLSSLFRKKMSTRGLRCIFSFLSAP